MKGEIFSMASFEEAYKLTKKWEGGYANLTGDTGGETMWGIARNFWGDKYDLKEFWKSLDTYRDIAFAQTNKSKSEIIDTINKLCEGNTQMVEICKKFYKKTFWDKLCGDKIKNQKVANNLFDFNVNAGRNGTKVFQKAVGVTADGIVGPATIAALNTANNDELVEARIRYYKSLRKPQFEKGWINRAEDFR